MAEKKRKSPVTTNKGQRRFDWRSYVAGARKAPCKHYPTCFDCKEPDCTYKGQW